MVYVTFQIRFTDFVAATTGKKVEYHAIKCNDYDQAVTIASDVNGLDGASYVRINRCGHLKHKDKTNIISGDEYWKKMYGIDYTNNM
jgi:hypothetical protein